MRTILTLACLLAVSPVIAAEAPAVQCGSLDRAKTIAAGRGEPFVVLTNDQWQFMRGLYVLDPSTPPGLPPGDSAAMSVRSDGSAAVIYIDGDRACSPMKLGKEGVDMLMQIGRGEVVHVPTEGAPL